MYYKLSTFSILLFTGAVVGFKFEQEIPLLNNNLFNSNDELNCPITLPLSCSNVTVIDNPCCFEYPGGVMLQTQFWDYNPSLGDNDTFTIHGLWPDNCSKDGTFQQFCNPRLNVNDVTRVLEDLGESELLEKMKRYWKSINGRDSDLWKHEFNKHGTCVTTLNPSCYGEDFKTNENVADYFKVAVDLFDTLPTFEWLEEAGIVPSDDQTYTKDQISDALNSKYGREVYFACDSKNALNEVWYFHQIQGSLRGEKFHRIESFNSPRCPNEGIKFIPKSTYDGSPTSTASRPHPTGDILVGSLKPVGQHGCLIRNGQWYTSGSCATYRLENAQFGGYNLKTGAGYCSVNENGEFSCSNRNEPYQFDYDKSTHFISAGGVNIWHADKIPRRFEKVSISRGEGELGFKLKFL